MEHSHRHTLLDLLSPTGSGSSHSTHSSADWAGILETALRQGVGALLEHRIKQKGVDRYVPAGVADSLRAFTRAVGFRNTQLYYSLTQALSTLKNASIPVIVLKGAYLAEHVYENIALRPMDDVDLLVRQEDLLRVEDLLTSIGYTHPSESHTSPQSTAPHHLAPFIRAGAAPIEVHWTIPPGEPFTIDVEGLWERAVPASIADVDVLVLSPEDLLLHLCLHAAVHHRFSMGLKPLCDVAETIRRFGPALQWGALCKGARAWSAGNSTYVALRIAREFIGAEVPPAVLRTLEPASFDTRLLEWAEEQIFDRKSDLADRSAISPRLAEWRTKPLLRKLGDVLRVAFPPTRDLARNYRVKPGSPFVLLYYPLRWKDLIIGRGGAILRLMTGDPRTMEMAVLYEKLIGSTTKETR